jgi:carbonic anhydrase
VAQSTVVQDAWLRRQSLIVHGWVYGLHNGFLLDLHINMDSVHTMDQVYQQAIADLVGRYASAP